MTQNKLLYVICHDSDLEWIDNKYGTSVDVLAHDEAVLVMIGRDMPLFYSANHFSKKDNDASIYICNNWYRDDSNMDEHSINKISLSRSFAAGMSMNIYSICREFFSLQYWCQRYETVFISCNESPIFIEVAKKFNNIQMYKSTEGSLPFLCSATERVLSHVPLTDWKTHFIRLLQLPFVSLLRGRTLFFQNWTLLHRPDLRGGVLVENSRTLINGAYNIKTYFAFQKKILEEFKSPDFKKIDVQFLTELLKSAGVNWDVRLLELISNNMERRYKENLEYFNRTILTYNNLFNFYRPKTIVLPTLTYEPYIIAAQLAKKRGIRVSSLVDGYPIVKNQSHPALLAFQDDLVDDIYAIGEQNKEILINSGIPKQAINTIKPYFSFKSSSSNNKKLYDVVIMTWIPNDENLNGRNGSRPGTLLEVLTVLKKKSWSKVAIKIKDVTEKKWLIPMLVHNNLIDDVDILEGSLLKYINHSKRVIGGISSAVGEFSYNKIPYYIYEPESNGYDKEVISSLTINAEVYRTPEQLCLALNNTYGSIRNVDQQLMFGGETLKWYI
jgi:hypothetical protein